MIRTFPARPAAPFQVQEKPRTPQLSTPARVAPGRLPDRSELGWAMVNLSLLTLLLGVLPRLF